MQGHRIWSAPSWSGWRHEVVVKQPDGREPLLQGSIRQANAGIDHNNIRGLRVLSPTQIMNIGGNLLASAVDG
jgi:hypothetical protein